MTLRPWRSIGRRTLLERPPWMRVGDESFELPDGRIIEDFMWAAASDWSMVAALTPRGELVLERCFKPGNGRVALVLPAGGLEEGEAPEVGARRELREETGYEAGSWTALGRFRMDPNYGISTGHLFLAEDARPTATPAGDDLEDLELVTMPLGRALELLRDGAIETLGAAAAIGLAAAELARR